MFRQLVYLSTASIPFSNAALLQMLEKVRPRNLSRSVTGILLYGDRAFVQILEGPSQSVEEIFSSIARDARHTSVTVVQDAMVERRDFEDWAMAFRKVDKDELSRFQGLRPLTKDAVTSIAGELSHPVARVFIRQFAESGYRW